VTTNGIASKHAPSAMEFQHTAVLKEDLDNDDGDDDGDGNVDETEEVSALASIL